jgi:hypothetical protein
MCSSLTRNLPLRLLTGCSSPCSFLSTCIYVAAAITTLEASLEKEQDLVSAAGTTVKVGSQTVRYSAHGQHLAIPSIATLTHNAICK